MEVVCKVAVSYMSFYGNIVQQNSAAGSKIVWLLVYLRHVSSKYMDSLDCRAAEDALTPSLRKAIVHQKTKASMSLAALNFASVATADSILRAANCEEFATDEGRRVRKSEAETTESEVYQRAQAAKFLKKHRLRQQEKAKNCAVVKTRRAMAVEEDSSDPDLHEEDVVLSKRTSIVRSESKQRICSRVLHAFQTHENRDYCRTCGFNLKFNPTGKFRCPSCSLVDTMDIQMHPFGILLLPEKTDALHMEEPKPFPGLCDPNFRRIPRHLTDGIGSAAVDRMKDLFARIKPEEMMK
eukprot:TRINITY_DN18711_c0_g1_i1.p1 TRINITY_DN18711_c0_g1~~TRINITY_DN18711_c0_g1_i1.p1  ORF type:complete len:296 (-),score=83.21 TRINITY_DN18711_c0_g1_i1:362-1249(-)